LGHGRYTYHELESSLDCSKLLADLIGDKPVAAGVTIFDTPTVEITQRLTRKILLQGDDTIVLKVLSINHCD